MCNQKAIHLLCAVLLLGTISTASAAIVAYYPMDEGSGTAAKDASGKGHDATITGTVKWAESKPGLGTALDFPGDAATANYLGAGTWDPSESTGQVSVAAWIKWAGANSTSTFQGIVTKCDGVFVAIRWQLTMSNSTNGIGFGFGGGAPVYPAPAPPVGEWQHVTFTHDGTTATMYINGTAQTTTSTVALGTGTGAAIVIGALNFQGTADGPFKGTVDEVYIFDNALSATEVGQVMQGGFANPYKSRSPNPSKGATDVPRDTALSWSAGKDVISHDVYFGTVFDDVNTATRSAPAGVLLSQGQTATDFDPAGLLDFGQTYYWRVDEVNAPSAGGTIFKGDVWSFTAEPYSYPVTAPIQATASSSYSSGTEPNNTVNGSGLTGDQHSDMITDMWVSSKTGPQPPWIQYEFDRVLKLDQMWVWNSNQAIEEILGFGVREVTIEVSTDANTWTAIPNVPEFAQATGLDDYVYNTIVDLGGAVAKYVKLTCLSTWGGGTQCSLSEVRFFSGPTHARAPEPANAATGVDVGTTLNWRPGRDAVRHEVYLGTDPNALPLATTVTDHRVALATLGAEYGQTYYWRVDEVNDAALPQSWEGDVWTFSTPVFEVVDDFESYNDQCGRIFFSWSDGYGHSGSEDCGVAPASGNGTGSTVGNADAPYAERDNVHSGAQAMPFSYDNTSGSGVSEAVLTFSPAQDWTAGGLKTLVLFFKGDPANGSGQVYVKINGTKVSYSGNPTALSTGLWNQWNVDLSGLSVQAVSSLTFGVSGTGKGDLYVDDIRLYGQAPAVAVPTDPGTGALAAYYAFEGDAQDAAGKGYNGTLMNEPTFGDSKAGLGKALALDGVNDYVDLPIGSLISTLTSATVSAWINFDTASTGSWVRVFDFGTSSTAGYMFLCPRQGTTGTMRFAITTGTNTGESGVNAPRALSAGWHHVAVVIDGVAKTVQLVLDGEVVASGATAVLPKDLGVTTQNWLGHSQWSGDGYYQGLIDEFRIYNRVLTVGEVRYLAGDR